jgi:hypothetical protein
VSNQAAPQHNSYTFTEIGKERGWPAPTRAQFDALRGPTGALLIGDAKTIAKKILYANEFSAASPASHSKWVSRRFRTKKYWTP